MILPRTLVSALATIPLAHATPSGTLADLQPILKWEKAANGVFVARIGEPDAELRYTDLAGAPPRVETLNSLPDLPLRDALQDAACRIDDDGRIMVRIPTAPAELIFGFGLQFDQTIRTGQVVELKVDHFKRGGGATHAPVPFYISSKGYGVLFNTARYLKVHCQIGSRRDSPANPPEVDRNPPADEKQPGPWLARPPADAVEANLHAKGLELIAFSGGDPQDVVARYNLYSGGGTLPPLWGLGFWHRTPSAYSAEQVTREVAEFKEHRIPLDVVGLEPGWQTKSYPCTFEWQRKRFPDPTTFLRQLGDDGIRVNIWVNPYVSKYSSIHEDMLPLSGSHMVWLGIVPDYRLPKARGILIAQHRREHFDIGISGYKIDEVDGYDHYLWPDHATFPSGTSGESMRQTYGMQLQQMVYHDLFRAHDRRTYSLVRASNGAAANLPYVLYSDSYGHQQYITGLSSASLAGILWCPELRSARDEREWINRMHTTCFSPLAQLDAWASGTKPWTFPDSTDAIRRTIALRMRLLPYLYTAFADYHLRGIPPVRSMLLETGFAMPNQKETDTQLDDTANPYGDGSHHEFVEDNTLYMFGPDILVAPFVEKQIERQVNLPPGSWYDFHSGKPVGKGGESITVTAAGTNDLPPLFARDGALIPMLAESVERTRDAKGATIKLHHYGTADGRARLYEDDTTTFAYERGACRLREFAVSGNELTTNTVHDECPPFYGPVKLTQATPDQSSAR